MSILDQIVVLIKYIYAILISSCLIETCSVMHTPSVCIPSKSADTKTGNDYTALALECQV